MDIESDRTRYGLTPPRSPFRNGIRILLASAVVVGGTALAGTLGGDLFKWHLLRKASRQLEAVPSMTDPASARSILEDVAAGLAGNTSLEAILLLAGIDLQLAELLPEQQMHLLRAAHRLDALRHAHSLEDHPPLIRMRTELLDSMIRFELGEEVAGKVALERAWAAFRAMEGLYPEDGMESLRSVLENSEAYLLVKSTDPDLRNPVRARKLAERMIARQRNTENGAFLDTVAKTLYATGEPEQALLVQREALRRAQARDLWILLQHYDIFRAAAGEP